MYLESNVCLFTFFRNLAKLCYLEIVLWYSPHGSESQIPGCSAGGKQHKSLLTCWRRSCFSPALLEHDGSGMDVHVVWWIMSRLSGPCMAGMELWGGLEATACPRSCITRFIELRTHLSVRMMTKQSKPPSTRHILRRFLMTDWTKWTIIIERDGRLISQVKEWSLLDRIFDTFGIDIETTLSTKPK